MNKLKSFIFTTLLFTWGAIIPIIYSFTFITRSSKAADHGAFIWSKVSLWMLKKICGIDHTIIGLEKLPKEACIIACKHQSMWETIVMHLLLHRPVYAFKKELLVIPFYGWFLTVMSTIKIDREGRASALKSLIKQSKNYLAKGQSVVIFPQGTRTPINADMKQYPYQAGIAAIYLSCNVKVVPMALNSGKFWPKKGDKTKGTISLSILDPIETGLSKKEFMDKLQDVTEKESMRLL